MREELEEIVDEMTKSPSILSNISHHGESPDKPPEGDDRISVQSEKNSGDPYHLRVGSKKVKKYSKPLLCLLLELIIYQNFLSCE